MVCLYCGGATQVTNSRSQRRSNTTWRRRSCTVCEATITTQEAPDLATAIVVVDSKRTNAFQPFSRDKLFISIYESCKHRKSAQKDATALTETILGRLYPLITEGSITRSDIFDTTADILTRFDKAAASHYRAYHTA